MHMPAFYTRASTRGVVPLQKEDRSTDPKGLSSTMSCAASAAMVTLLLAAALLHLLRRHHRRRRHHRLLACAAPTPAGPTRPHVHLL